MKDVTVVITSCNRHDLLLKTIRSFLWYNTYQGIKAIIVIEDGDKKLSEKNLLQLNESCEDFGIQFLFINTVDRVGQIEAADLAYSMVTTPYVFHCEDDWEFYDMGFIEESKAILEKQPKCLQVWLRDRKDTNGHPVRWSGGRIEFGMMMFAYKGMWHGFSFNPGLRRMAQYHEIGKFSNVAIWRQQKPWEAEAAIGLWYYKRGYWAAITPKGYVKHIGVGRHVN